MTKFWRKLKFIIKEYPLQINLILLGLSFQLIKNLPINHSILPPIIQKYYALNAGFIENLIYAFVFTNIIFILVDYFASKNDFLFENFKNIANDEIAEEVINKKNVFMLRFTLHPKVDEAEEEIADYSLSNDQWDWHICLCDPKHKLPSKYNDFSYLIESFFKKIDRNNNKIHRCYSLDESLKTTELAILNQAIFTNIISKITVPYINYIYKDSLINYDIANFQSIIFIGVFSSEPAKSAMPNLKSFVGNFKANKNNIQFHRLIFNLPNIENNIMFTNAAADKISKHFFSQIEKIEYEKDNNGNDLSIYIPNNVTEELKNWINTKTTQSIIDFFHYALNEKTFKCNVPDQFNIEDWVDTADIPKFIEHNKYILKKLPKSDHNAAGINTFLQNHKITTVYLPSRLMENQHES